MDVLLARHPSDQEARVRNGAARWFTLRPDQIHLDNIDDPDIIAHFKPFCEGSDAVIQPFALWALNLAKNLFSNSLVESWFSILTMFKSKYRGQLADECLEVPLVMRTETKFVDQAFDELMAAMKRTDDSFKRRLRGKRQRPIAPPEKQVTPPPPALCSPLS